MATLSERQHNAKKMHFRLRKHLTIINAIIQKEVVRIFLHAHAVATHTIVTH